MILGADSFWIPLNWSALEEEFDTEIPMKKLKKLQTVHCY